MRSKAITSRNTLVVIALHAFQSGSTIVVVDAVAFTASGHGKQRISCIHCNHQIALFWNVAVVDRVNAISITTWDGSKVGTLEAVQSKGTMPIGIAVALAHVEFGIKRRLANIV